jgi:hypothetical protein
MPVKTRIAVNKPGFHTRGISMPTPYFEIGEQQELITLYYFYINQSTHRGITTG